MIRRVAELYQLILNNIEDGIALCDRRSRLIFSNCYFRKTCEELTRRTSTRKILPREIRRIIRLFIKRPTQNKTVHIIKSRRGEEFFLTLKQVIYRKTPLILLTFHKKVLREQEGLALLKRNYKITFREFEIMTLIRKGLHNKEIADVLKLSPHTVSAHIRNIFRKMDVSNRTELIGIIDDILP